MTLRQIPVDITSRSDYDSSALYKQTFMHTLIDDDRSVLDCGTKSSSMSLRNEPAEHVPKRLDHDSPAQQSVVEHIGMQNDEQEVLGLDLEKDNALSRTKTGNSVAIPRSQRLGMLARFTLLPEIEDPVQYPKRIKTFIVFIVAIAAANGPLSCGILFPALPDIEKELHTTPTIANLSISFFLLGMGVSPLWLAYISEHFGRRSVYLVTFTFYIIFTILCGFSNSMSELIAFRILAAMASGSAQALGAGSIADIYIPQERGGAMGVFYLGPLIGPLLSPVIGGAVTASGSWRTTQWFLAALGGLTLIMMIFCLPETLRNPKKLAIHKKGTIGTRAPTKWEVTYHTLFDPFKTFMFFKYPAVLCAVIYASTIFGGLYVMNISIEYMYHQFPYNFSTIIVGCLYLGNSLGYILGSVIGGRWSDHVMKVAALSNGGQMIPEKRIGVNAWAGSVFAPLGLLWWGWTIDRHLFWFVPLIGTFFFGMGTMFIFSTITTYLVDALPGRSSSAMALNNFVRNIFSCVGSIVAVPLIDAIGSGRLFSIVSGILSLSTVTIVLIVIKGDQWRAKQKLDI